MMRTISWGKKWFIPIVVLLCSVGCNPEISNNPTTPSTSEITPSAAELTSTLPPSETPEPPPTQSPTPTSEMQSSWSAIVEKGTWVLVGFGDALNPTIVEPGTYATLQLDALENQVAGFGGCNNYAGTFTADENGQLEISSPLISTLIACQTGMEQEGIFLGALEKATGYKLTEEGFLILTYDSDAAYAEQLIFIPETPLLETTWVLTGYGDPNNLTAPKPGVTTTAVFSSLFTISGSTGCNNYFGSFTSQNSQISINLPNINLAACGIGTDQEQAFLSILENIQSYRVGIAALELISADGNQVLKFSSQHLPLENVRWQLISINNKSMPEGTNAYMLLTPANNPGAEGNPDSIHGNAGCNTFSGTYNIAEGTVSTGPLASTQMMCEESLMQIEQAFMNGLENIQGYEIMVDQLSIQTYDGEMLFSADRLPLEGPKWILTGRGPRNDPQPPLAGAIFTAEFNREFGMPSGTKIGGTGCNEYTATYFSALDKIKVNLPQTSQKACSEAQMEAEQGYFLSLNASDDYRILGNELYIYYDQSVLIFIGDYSASLTGPLAPLNGTFWRLTSIDDTNVLLKPEVTIGFEINSNGKTGRISGSGGCNTYNAEIREVFKLGPINSTKTLCETPEGVMEQENTYLDALQNANGISFEGSKLTITTTFGTLHFVSIRPELSQPTPTPTPQALSAVIVSPKNEYAGKTLKFDGSESAPASEIQKYQWWFSDDFTAEGVSVERTFTSPGFYDAILTVTTKNGEKAEASVKVNIQVNLIGTSWIMHDGSASAYFGEGTVSGNAGCNDYSASYSATVAPGGPYEISISGITVTGKTCDENTMKKEQVFLSELDAATHYSIRTTSLTITTPQGTLNFYTSE